jgi:hypothetical protein
VAVLAQILEFNVPYCEQMIIENRGDQATNLYNLAISLILFHAALGLLAQANCDLTLHKEG